MNRQNYFRTFQQKEILGNNELNPNLLAQIKTYCREVEKNPNYDKWLDIKFNNKSLFYNIANNTYSGTDELIDSPGVSICVLESRVDTEDDWDTFHLDEIAYTFNRLEVEKNEEDDEDDYDEEDEFEIYYINCSFDAEYICAIIQYLAKLHGCSSNKITLEEHEWGLAGCESNSESSEPNNERFIKGLLATIICIPVCIFLSYSAIEFEETQYYLCAALSAGCVIWGIREMLKARSEE